MTSEKEVLGPSEIRQHMDRLLKLPEDDLRRQLLIMDTNILIDYAECLVVLLKRGVRLSICSTAIEELQFKVRQHGFRKGHGRVLHSIEEFLNLIELPAFKGRTVLIMPPPEGELLNRLEKLAQFTLKIYVRRPFVDHLEQFYSDVLRTVDFQKLDSFIERWRTGYWDVIRKSYERSLGKRLFEIWKDEKEVRDEYVASFNQVLGELKELFFARMPLEKAKEILAGRMRLDRHDVQIAAHYLAHEATQKDSQRFFLSADKDVRELIRLYWAFYPA